MSDKYGISLHRSEDNSNVDSPICPNCKADKGTFQYCLKCRWSIPCPFCGCPVLRHSMTGFCSIHKSNCKKQEETGISKEAEMRLEYIRNLKKTQYRIPQCFLCRVDLNVKIEGNSETLLCENCFEDFKKQMKENA